MKSLLRSLFIFTGVMFLQGAFAQEVTNIKVTPTQSSIEITYDLDANAACSIVLYYSDDKAVTWKGPLQKVSGDVGASQMSGKGKKIIWDAASELGSVEGLLQFKIVATYVAPQEQTLQSKLQQRIIDVEKQKKDAKLTALKKKRNIWIVPAVVTAGVGGYAYAQTGTLYEKYKTATTDAAKIRGQVQTMALVYPIAFAAAGFSVIEFIIQNGKYSKEKKKKVAFTPIYVPRGAGLNLTVSL
jgi:hypothetical protein